MLSVTNNSVNKQNMYSQISFQAKKLPSAYSRSNLQKILKENPQMTFFDKLMHSFSFLIGKTTEPAIYSLEKGEKEINTKPSIGLMGKFTLWLLEKSVKG